VFVIVMENSSVSEALSGNFVESLASKYAMLTDYHSVGSPSLPNYLALTSGSTWAVADDGYHVLPPDDIGHQLTAAGKSWRAYMDAMTGDCFSSPYPYAVKHNPFAYYGGACPPNVVPLTQLQRGLAAGAPAFTWITPDMCHDGHDCGKDQSDGWLAATVPQILASSAWRDGGVLFVVWDESDAGPSDTVPALVVAPNIRVHSSARYHDHYSLLATIEDRLGLSRLGAAKQATPITEVFSG
jgi:phospholipase C